MALHANPVGVPHAGFGGGGVAALVLIVDPGAKPRIDPEQVAATPARLRAAAELVARLGGWLGSKRAAPARTSCGTAIPNSLP